MSTLALVTAEASLPDDYDMLPLVTACRARGVDVEVCLWDDPSIDWSCFDAVILRSPWDYSERLREFLAWCEYVTAVTELFNPLSVVRWSIDKHYLMDLAAHGASVVPSSFVECGASPILALAEFFAAYPEIEHFVVKPTVGCYCKGVRRYNRCEHTVAAAHITRLLQSGSAAILQPYIPSIDNHGETNLIYFDGVYSHAIRKQALLLESGTVNVPTYDFRAACDADPAERRAAEIVLDAAGRHLRLRRPLLYARVDLLRGSDGKPQLLELEVAEPSLSLPFAEASASRFAKALAEINRI